MADTGKIKGTESILEIREKIREDERRRELAKEQQQDRQKEQETLAKLLRENGGFSSREAMLAAKALTDEKHKNDEKLKDGDQVIDLSFILAHSLQMLYSETDPVQEYHAWIDDAHKVIANMNDGTITQGDLDAKIEFLDNLDQRENEIKAVMSIYRGSSFEGAKKQLEFLQYKWQRLMELRSLVKSSTKNHVEDKNAENEKKRAEAALAMLPLMLQDEKDRSENGDLAWDAAHQTLAFAARGYFMANALADVYGKDELLPEYKAFVEQAGKIIHNMNDDEISAQDLHERNLFLQTVNMREAMILAHLSLYEGRTDPFALKQKAYLRYKWERLMEIKNAVVNNTKSEEEAFRNREVPEETRIRALAAVVVLNKLYQQEKKRWQNGDYDLNNQGVFRYKYQGHFTEVPSVRLGLLQQYGLAGGVRFEDGLHQAFMDKVATPKQMSNAERAEWIMKMRGIAPSNQKLDTLRRNYLSNGNQMFTIERYHRAMAKDARHNL